jgi:voltage-gated potassium channel
LLSTAAMTFAISHCTAPIASGFWRCSRPASGITGTAKRPSACWNVPTHSTRSLADFLDLTTNAQRNSEYGVMNTQSNLQRWERYAEWPLAAAALLFLGLFSVQVLARPHGREAYVLWVISWIVWGLFIVDYVVRLYLASNRWHWFVRHLLDFAIVALPLVRPLRLLRLLVLIGVLQSAIGNAFRGRIVVYTVSGVLLLIYTSSLAVFDKERFLPGATINSFGKALWWSITTVTTVGYGDVYPVTNTGRIIAVLLMIGGISLVGVVTAALASWIIERVSEEETVVQTATAAHIEELRGEIRDLSEELRGRGQR